MDPVLTVEASSWIKDAFLAGGAVSFFLLLCCLIALVKVYRDKCKEQTQYGELLENRHIEFTALVKSSTETMVAVRSSLEGVEKSLEKLERS